MSICSIIYVVNVYPFLEGKPTLVEEDGIPVKYLEGMEGDGKISGGIGGETPLAPPFYTFSTTIISN